MPLFSYVAKDLSGADVRGTVDADSETAARSALSAKALSVTSLQEEAPPLPVEPPPVFTPAADFAPSAPQSDAAPDPVSAQHRYFPLARTLRLYAGWLLAYYGVVYALGWYQFSRDLPFEIPFVESLMLSPLVLQFTAGAFLFMLAGSIIEQLRLRTIASAAVWILGAAVFVGYRANIL